MRYGLIVDDEVVQVQPRPGAEGEWAELPGGITNGCRREAGEWVVPTPPPPEPEASASDPLAELLIEKGLITAQELEAKRQGGNTAQAVR